MLVCGPIRLVRPSAVIIDHKKWVYRLTLENCFHKDRRRNVGCLHYSFRPHSTMYFSIYYQKIAFWYARTTRRVILYNLHEKSGANLIFWRSYSNPRDQIALSSVPPLYMYTNLVYRSCMCVRARDRLTVRAMPHKHRTLQLAGGVFRSCTLQY